MNNPRHTLAGTALAAAILASVFPAHAGLIGGSGSVGGGLSGGIGPVGGALNGTLGGHGSLHAPSPRPVIDRTQERAGAAKDTATATVGAGASATGGSATGGSAAAGGSVSGSVKR
ncbi:hypothetical protein [Piscinibacter sp.]|uniref:hypothetical protein n=1 Tax=Piscinibacter sp. TaxID=1903157 RepID=UPI002C18EF71|nr:hypothetical protein [Albitalea sp.]HUG24432.1 hypothetical protein [Albitalea sp.]